MSTALKHRDVIIAMTAAGRPQQEIADAAEMSVRTLYRRLQDPDMQADVAAAALDLERQALAQLGELRATALKQLGNLIIDADPGIRLRACKIILDSGLAHRAAVQASRVEVLEFELAQLRDDVWLPAE